jgi:hypothetical protein
MDTQDSPQPGLGGSHHLPLYSILCTSPRGPHPNGFFFRDFQVGVPKSPRLRLPWLWGAITLHANLGLRWSLKQNYSLRQGLSNDMSHAICTHAICTHTICTHGNWVDSRLLVVGSQIANLTPGPSFGHNLCFKCPNGWCEPILDIYVLRAFHWHKKILKPLSFDPYNRPLKIQESTGTPTPKVELPWGVSVHSFTPSHTPRSMLCNFWLPSWPATLQTLALVTSPRLGLRHWHSMRRFCNGFL